MATYIAKQYEILALTKCQHPYERYQLEQLPVLISEQVSHGDYINCQDMGS